MLENLKNKIYNLTRKSEKFFKTDMIYLVKGGFWLSVAQFFGSFSSFLISIVFANFISKEDYGIYKYVLAITGILTIATLRGINVSITQSVAQGNEGTALKGLKTKIKWGLLGGIAAIVLSGYYYFHNNNVLAIMLLVSAPFLPFKDSFSAYGAILNGKKDFRRIAIYGIIPNLINTVALGLILFFTKSIYYTLFYFMFSWTIMNFYFLIKTIRIHKLNNIVDENSISYGKHISVVTIISSIAGYFDKLIIFHFLGAVSVAVYTIAMAPITQINGALGNINPLAAPKFSELSTDNLKSSLHGKIKKIMLTSFGISLLYIVMAKFLFSIFFPKYMDAVLYSQILSFSIPFTIASRFRITALQSRFDKKKYDIYTYATSIIQIILLFFGGYLYGLLGISIALLVVSVFQFFATDFLIKKL